MNSPCKSACVSIRSAKAGNNASSPSSPSSPEPSPVKKGPVKKISTKKAPKKTVAKKAAPALKKESKRKSILDLPLDSGDEVVVVAEDPIVDIYVA
jgi:hypothetical protein